MTSKGDSDKRKKKQKREKSNRKSLHKTEGGSAEERADVAFLKWHVQVKQRACCESKLRAFSCVCLSVCVRL